MNNLIPPKCSEPFTSSPNLNAQSAEESSTTTNSSSGKNSPKAGVFSSLFRPISRGDSPRPTTDSPSGNRWSRISSFSSFFGRVSSPEKEIVNIEKAASISPTSGLAKTKIYSSPEKVIVASPIQMGFDSFSAVNHPTTKEAILSQQGSFEGGDEDRKKLTHSLIEKREAARQSRDPESQTKKDIDRMAYFLNGKKVNDVETIKAFLGEAAEIILIILNQTISNVAGDIIANQILEEGPAEAAHAELTTGESGLAKTSIRISKREEEEKSPTFLIEVESKGPVRIFLKKTEKEGIADFDFVTLEKDDFSTETNLTAEGRQVVALELAKDNSNAYSMCCSKLLREYQIN